MPWNHTESDQSVLITVLGGQFSIVLRHIDWNIGAVDVTRSVLNTFHIISLYNYYINLLHILYKHWRMLVLGWVTTWEDWAL